jgi:ferredoxin-NADP reductase
MAFIEPFPYYPATLTAICDESNALAKTIRFKLDAPWKFRAGQHCILRLTDQHGYIAARDYSLSSAPSSGVLELTILKARGGEVSTWAHDKLSVGDTVQVSDPLGLDFSWTSDNPSPLLLVAGGIGVAPLMSIWREHRLSNSSSSIHLAYSVRTKADVCFVEDLTPTRANEKVQLWTTREAASGTHSGRMTAETLRPLLLADQRIFICGPTSFVDAIEHLLHHELAVPAERILTERFG